ncbi:FtsX-like permease family protein [Candidatus Parabeggiatoa sp. HSG14]|uniref:ABC transporter permease n=1 Tax=Candidatus Parabeggiatoa sp. HSG14 TaxID=3055593 RepID=UPI0025A73AAC|nr:FtsX-like permease family protein [Thiotrichales bacterium HSG14]
MGIILRLAWRNIWRHPRRSGITITTITFAASLLVFIITLQLGSYDMMIDNNLRILTGHFQVQRTGYLDKPKIRSTIADSQQLAKELRKINGIVEIAARANGFALAASEERSYGVQVIGVETAHESNLSIIPKRIQSGQFLSSDIAQEVVIGKALARNLKVKVGDELTLLGSGRDGSIAAAVLPIIGIFDSGMPEIDRSVIEMPLTTFQDIFSMGESVHVLVGLTTGLDRLESILAQVREKIPPNISLQEGEKRLKESNKDLVVLDWNTLLPGLFQIIQADKMNGWVMYGCLILIVTFSVLNTFLMAVLERTREFGVMLALGTKHTFIGKLVMLESLFLTLLGLAIGLAIGIAITLYFYAYGFSYPGMKEIGAQFGLPDKITPQLSLFSFTIGPALILIFTMIGSLYPALRIRKLKPVDAMKSV